MSDGLLLLLVYAGAFWPVTALVVLAVVVCGFVVGRRWLRGLFFGIALAAALVGGVAVWVTAHLRFGW